MGLFEFLRKAVRDITGKDPEKQDSSALYRFYDTTTGNPWVTAGTASPFKYYAASPAQLPPGWVYSDTMEMLPLAENVGNVAHQRFVPYYTAGSNTTLASIIKNTATIYPFNSTAAGGLNLLQSSSAPTWKPFYVTGTLVGGTVDLTIGAAAAGDQYEAVLLSCGQATVTDQATFVYSILDWEDDDTTAPAAGSSYGFGFKHDVTNSHMFGNPIQNLTSHACWGLGNDAQGLQIEWTQVGGAGTENVFIAGIFRVH